MAEEALENRVRQDPSLTGMGSTLVALLLNKDRAMIAHLGDSRCYQMRGEKMIFRTKDHSLVGELVQYKTLTEEQARTSPQSNVITRALGATNNHVAEIEYTSYRRGDRFILCSDGVWGIMPQEQLLSRFSSTPNIGALVENLSKEIDNIGFSTDGHHDNHTLAVVDLGENSNIQEKMNTTAKIIIGTLACLLAISLVINIVSLSRGHKATSEEVMAIVQGNQQKGDAQKDEKLKQGNSTDDNQQGISQLQEEINKIKEQLEKKERELSDMRKEREERQKEEQRKVNEQKQDDNQSRQDVVENQVQEEKKEQAEKTDAEKLAESVVSLLEQMKNASSTDSKELNKQKYSLRDQAVLKLTQLKESVLPKTKDRINEVIDIMTNKKQWAGLIVPSKPDSDGKYRSPKKSKEKIDDVIEKVRVIIDDLSK